MWLDVGDTRGRFSDNGFLMLDKTKTVQFYAWVDTTVADIRNSLTVRSLMDIYYPPPMK